jgi:hypothetical protein
MRNSIGFSLFFVIGGFATSAVGVAYFASGEAARGTDVQSYTALIQIPLGIAVTLYGLTKRYERSQP